MRAALCSRFGRPEDVLTVGLSATKPTPSDNQVLIKVSAVSLSPSDYRGMRGDAPMFKGPEGGVFPYIPGGDLSGVVVESNSEKYSVGQRVVATWKGWGMGALAEFAVVDDTLVEVLGDNLTMVEGAALANSAVNAMLAIEDVDLTGGERVLVIGASGGMGSALVELLSNDRKCSFIAGVSTDCDVVVNKLHADRCIDYRRRKWSEIDEFKLQPFDVIFDCAEGATGWDAARSSGVLKKGTSGGKFVAVVINEWEIIIHHYYQLFTFLIPPLFRTVYSKILPWSYPSYSMHVGAPRGDSLRRLLDLAQSGKVTAFIDERGPFPFTTEGVRQAFEVHESKHAHGKVVIEVAKEKQ